MIFTIVIMGLSNKAIYAVMICLAAIMGSLGGLGWHLETVRLENRNKPDLEMGGEQSDNKGSLKVKSELIKVILENNLDESKQKLIESILGEELVPKESGEAIPYGVFNPLINLKSINAEDFTKRIQHIYNQLSQFFRDVQKKPRNEGRVQKEQKELEKALHPNFEIVLRINDVTNTYSISNFVTEILLKDIIVWGQIDGSNYFDKVPNETDIGTDEWRVQNLNWSDNPENVDEQGYMQFRAITIEYYPERHKTGLYRLTIRRIEIDQLN